MAWAKFKHEALVSLTAPFLTCIATVTPLQLFGQSGPAAPGSRLKLPVGTNTPAIAMGRVHGIILASDGSLWAWGENGNGFPVLGLGNTKPQTSLHRIGDETDWTDVACSDSHALAVKSDGTLWGWGANFRGQIGDGSIGAKATRRFPVPGPPGSDWKQVAAGATHSLAVERNGTLWAWGSNRSGELGIGTTSNSVEAVQVGSSTNWVKVWAEAIQTVGLQSDGSLWFWGSLSGRGGSDTNQFLVPTRVSPDTNWVDVCFGFFNVLSIKADGTLWAWGRNAGIYTGAPIQLVNPVPARVGKENDWKACASAGSFYHLLTKKDGSLWALDASDHLFVDKPVYKPLAWKRIPIQKDIVAFGTTSRNGTGVALTRDGEVWAWGRVLGEYASVSGSQKETEPQPILRDTPWLLPNIDPAAPRLK